MQLKSFSHPNGGMCCLCGSTQDRKNRRMSSAWVNLQQDGGVGTPFYSRTRCLGTDPIHEAYIQAMGLGMAEAEAAEGKLYAHTDCFGKMNRAWDRAKGIKRNRPSRATSTKKGTGHLEPAAAAPASSPSTSGAALEGPDPTDMFPIPHELPNQPTVSTRRVDALLAMNQSLLLDNAELQAAMLSQEENLDRCIARVKELEHHEKNVDRCMARVEELEEEVELLTCTVAALEQKAFEMMRAKYASAIPRKQKRSRPTP